jgi:hypothetical protein
MSTLTRYSRTEIIGELEDIYGPDCFYCGVVFSESLSRSKTIDHFIPRCDGGTDEIENLRLACYACNHTKGDIWGDEFLDSQWLINRQNLIVNNRLRKLGIRPDGKGFWHPKSSIHRISNIGKVVRLRCDACGTRSNMQSPLGDFPCQTFNNVIG